MYDKNSVKIAARNLTALLQRGLREASISFCSQKPFFRCRHCRGKRFAGSSHVSRRAKVMPADELFCRELPYLALFSYGNQKRIVLFYEC
jgi:hypothetical protein